MKCHIVCLVCTLKLSTLKRALHGYGNKCKRGWGVNLKEKEEAPPMLEGLKYDNDSDGARKVNTIIQDNGWKS